MDETTLSIEPVAEDARPEPAALVVDGLTIEFQTRNGPVRAVDDVSFRLLGSETIGIVGESGCGKSVTGLSLLGLLPTPPARVAAGHVQLRRRNGRQDDILAMSPSQWPSIRGDEIAMIFQEPMTSLNPMRTVGDQVAEPLVIHRSLSHSQAMDCAAELLERVGLADARRRLRAYPHELSGGMRQRVMIAMALACSPSVLIADEPTTALDVTIQAQILQLFRDLQRTSRMAMLFITHDLGVVAEIAQRVIVMYAGQVVEEGSVTTILTRPRHPYTVGLLASLPRIDQPQRDGGAFYAIPGHVPELGNLPAGCRFEPRCKHAVPGRCHVKPDLEQVAPDHTVRCVRWREIADA